MNLNMEKKLSDYGPQGPPRIKKSYAVKGLSKDNNNSLKKAKVISNCDLLGKL